MSRHNLLGRSQRLRLVIVDVQVQYSFYVSRTGQYLSNHTHISQSALIVTLHTPGSMAWPGGRYIENICGINHIELVRWIQFAYSDTWSVHYPRFIVFPSPLGWASVNLAHFSSFILFSSSFSLPNTVPSCSASIESCSDDVSWAADAALLIRDVRGGKECQWEWQRTHHRW